MLNWINPYWKTTPKTMVFDKQTREVRAIRTQVQTADGQIFSILGEYPCQPAAVAKGLDFHVNIRKLAH